MKASTDEILSRLETGLDSIGRSSNELRALMDEHHEHRSPRKPNLMTGISVLALCAVGEITANAFMFAAGDAAGAEPVTYSTMGGLLTNGAGFFVGNDGLRALNHKSKVPPHELKADDLKRRRFGLIKTIFGAAVLVSTAVTVIRLRAAPDPDLFLDFSETGVTLAQTFGDGPSVMMCGAAVLSALISIATGMHAFSDPVDGATPLAREIDDRIDDILEGIEQNRADCCERLDTRLKEIDAIEARQNTEIEAAHARYLEALQDEAAYNAEIDQRIIMLRLEDDEKKRRFEIVNRGEGTAPTPVSIESLESRKIRELELNADEYRPSVSRVSYQTEKLQLQEELEKLDTRVLKRIAEFHSHVDAFLAPDVARVTR